MDEQYGMDMLEEATNNLWGALRATRQQGSYLSLDMIAKIIVDVFEPEDVKMLLKHITNAVNRKNEVNKEPEKKESWVDDLL